MKNFSINHVLKCFLLFSSMPYSYMQSDIHTYIQTNIPFFPLFPTIRVQNGKQMLKNAFPSIFFPHSFILLLKNMHLFSFNTGVEKFSSKLKMILMINCAWKCSSLVFFLLLPYSSTNIPRGCLGVLFMYISDTSWIIMPFVLEVITF